MKLNLRTFRRSLPVFLTFIILFEAAAYTALTPRPQERFFEFYVLGANRMASDYYPNNSSLIQVGAKLLWYVGVSNQMGTLQFVDVRVKLGNTTTNPPNDTTASPSPAPLVLDFKHFILDNGTWEIPFTWQVLNFTTSQGGHSPILQLRIGNTTYSIQNTPICTSPSSCTFRFIFELWTWNTALNDFQVGWWNGDQHRIAWLQLWFSLTPGAH